MSMYAQGPLLLLNSHIGVWKFWNTRILLSSPFSALFLIWFFFHETQKNVPSIQNMCMEMMKSFLLHIRLLIVRNFFRHYRLIKEVVLGVALCKFTFTFLFRLGIQEMLHTPSCTPESCPVYPQSGGSWLCRAKRCYTNTDWLAESLIDCIVLYFPNTRMNYKPQLLTWLNVLRKKMGNINIHIWQQQVKQAQANSCCCCDTIGSSRTTIY